MIIRVWRNVSQSKLMSKVVVATDDQRIMDVCRDYDVPAIMTLDTINSGTDRVYAAYSELIKANNDYKSDIIVNIQGDEPLLSADEIDILLSQFLLSVSDVGTLVTKIANTLDLFDTGCVKVVLNSAGNAMYFSRSPIPCQRDIPQSEWLANATYWKHIGIYAYRRQALEQFVKHPISNYESLEKLEQLRLLEQNATFLCVETNANLVGVDTPDDLEKIRKEVAKLNK